MNISLRNSAPVDVDLLVQGIYDLRWNNLQEGIFEFLNLVLYQEWPKKSPKT